MGSSVNRYDTLNNVENLLLIDAFLSAHTIQKSRSLERSEHLLGFHPGHRCDFENDIFKHLHINTAQAKHHQVTQLAGRGGADD